jgi:hypothetical protein
LVEQQKIDIEGLKKKANTSSNLPNLKICKSRIMQLEHKQKISTKMDIIQ